MHNPLVYSLTEDAVLVQSLAKALGAHVGRLAQRRFPDGECYLRILDDCTACPTVVVADLAYPDAKIPRVLFLAETLRELGASPVGLIAPYLPYMRQDKPFQTGEAITSRHFAGWISRAFDWLVTVDPHLHRYPSLDALYSIPSRVAHAARAIASWVTEHVPRPVLFGPDAESEQWVAEVARRVGAPHAVFRKRRFGDRNVAVEAAELTTWRERTPVVVDDVISSGQTMIAAVRRVREAGLAAPLCIGVHGISADEALQALYAAGAQRVLICRTVAHNTLADKVVQIDVSTLVAEAVVAVTAERGE